MSETEAQNLNPPSTTTSTFPAKVLLWHPKPADLIALGYTEVQINRRDGRTDAWVEATTVDTRIPLSATTYNYFFFEACAKPSYEYQAVTVGAGQTDIEYGPIKALDTSFEAILTIQELKDRYLFGLEGALSDDSGVPLPDSVYAHYIRAAIARFEQKTNLRVLPKYFEEYHDWYEDYVRQFFGFWSNEYPIRQICTVEQLEPRSSPRVFPESWWRYEADSGEIHLLADANAALVPLNTLVSYKRYIPQAFKITYFAGFPPNEIPQNLIDMIGKEASMGPLNIGGDLLGGAGIASQSISLDGLSTTFNTTSSATNAGFGARLIQYTKENKESYADVKAYYRNLRMRIA